MVRPARDHVLRARELGHPEGVDHARRRPPPAAARPAGRAGTSFGVGLVLVAEPDRAQRQVHGAPGRDVQLVRGDDALARVVELPPPLVARARSPRARCPAGLRGQVQDRGRPSARRRRPGSAPAGSSRRSRAGCCRGSAAGSGPAGSCAAGTGSRSRTQQALDDDEDAPRDPEHGHEQVVDFCAYGPCGFSASCGAFGAQADASTARPTRPRTNRVRVRTFLLLLTGCFRGHGSAADCSTAPAVR